MLMDEEYIRLTWNLVYILGLGWLSSLNMDRNCHIDALIIRSYDEGNISLTWNLVYIISLGWLIFMDVTY